MRQLLIFVLLSLAACTQTEIQAGPRVYAASFLLSEPGMTIDGGIAVRGANLQLAETLAGVGPYGAGNPEPRFVIRSAVIAHADPVGRDQSHLRLSLTDESGKRLNGIAFGAVETPMGQALLKHGGAPFHIAGKIRVNSWQGRSSAQIIIEDAAPVW